VLGAWCCGFCGHERLETHSMRLYLFGSGVEMDSMCLYGVRVFVTFHSGFLWR